LFCGTDDKEKRLSGLSPKPKFFRGSVGTMYLYGYDEHCLIHISLFDRSACVLGKIIGFLGSIGLVPNHDENDFRALVDQVSGL
jgi:hypothetical protein